MRNRSTSSGQPAGVSPVRGDARVPGVQLLREVRAAVNKRAPARILETAPAAQCRPDLARLQSIDGDRTQDLPAVGGYRHLQLVEVEGAAVLGDRPIWVSVLEMHPSHPLEPIAAQVALDLVLIRVVRELTWLAEKGVPSRRTPSASAALFSWTARRYSAGVIRCARLKCRVATSLSHCPQRRHWTLRPRWVPEAGKPDAWQACGLDRPVVVAGPRSGEGLHGSLLSQQPISAP